MIEHFSLQPEDMEPDNSNMVTDDAIRRYIVKAINDPEWRTWETKGLIINDDGTWYSISTYEISGHWYVDGPELDIMINNEE